MSRTKITFLIAITLSLLFATAHTALAPPCDAHEMTAALLPIARSYADAIKLSNTLIRSQQIIGGWKAHVLFIL
jgi:hypothetical protein